MFSLIGQHKMNLEENKTAIAQIYYFLTSKCLNLPSKHQ